MRKKIRNKLFDLTYKHLNIQQAFIHPAPLVFALMPGKLSQHYQDCGVLGIECDNWVLWATCNSDKFKSNFCNQFSTVGKKFLNINLELAVRTKDNRERNKRLR